MCLTIPKKVVSIQGDTFIVENPAGNRQEVKSIIPLSLGDVVLTQQNIAIEKVTEEEYQELLRLMSNQ